MAADRNGPSNGCWLRLLTGVVILPPQESFPQPRGQQNKVTVRLFFPCRLVVN